MNCRNQSWRVYYDVLLVNRRVVKYTIVLATCPVSGVAMTNTRNVVKFVGLPVIFNCQTNSTSPIRWHYYAPRGTHDVVLYIDGQLAQRYADRYLVSEVQTSGQSTFFISNVQLTDAGRYECRQARKAKYDISFELIVLGQCFID